MIFYFYVAIMVLSILFCAYGVYTLNQARKTLRESRANAERAATVFNHARNVHAEVLRIQAHVKQMLPTTASAEIREPEMAGDFDDDEICMPEYDYPNFDGLPVSADTPAAVMESLLNHGFIVRFNVPSLEVHLAYQKPGTNYDPVRVTYNPPADIFPVNNLHEAGKAATAIWAAKKFVSMNPFPEFDKYTYLHT
jgi:hypothetical protein